MKKLRIPNGVKFTLLLQLCLIVISWITHFLSGNLTLEKCLGTLLCTSFLIGEFTMAFWGEYRKITHCIYNGSVIHGELKGEYVVGFLYRSKKMTARQICIIQDFNGHEFLVDLDTVNIVDNNKITIK